MSEIKDINDLFKQSDNFDRDFKLLKKKAETVDLHPVDDRNEEDIHHHNSYRGNDIMMNVLPVISLSEMEEPEPMAFLVEDLLPEGYLSAIYADGGKGKSYLALTIATSIVSGMPFLDKEVVKTNALYLDFELEVNEQVRRAYKVARGLGLERPPEGLLYLNPGIQEGVSSRIEELVEPLRQLINDKAIGFVVIDSIGAAAEGDTEKAQVVCELFKEIRKLGVTTLLIDHQAKLGKGENYRDKTAFGSVYKSNLCRSIFQLQTVDDNKEGQIRAILRHTKANFVALSTPIGFSMSFGDRFIVAPDEEVLEMANAQDNRQGITEKVTQGFIMLDGEATADEIATEINENIGTVRNNITQRKGDDIEDTGNKKGKATIYKYLGNYSSSSHPLSKNDYDDKSLSFENAKQLIKETFNAEEVPPGAPFELLSDY